ncbi:kinase-like domain-containing protein [Mycena olivaceomarginata]|nr:kinase-like domain-containing protein [Mycena olivaceomarginata]
MTEPSTLWPALHTETTRIDTNFESEEFWASPSLDNWLSACNETLCHNIWHSAHGMSTLERVEVMHLALNMLPCNLTTYAYSLIRRSPGHDIRGLDVLKQLGGFVEDRLGALQKYRQDIQILVGVMQSTKEKYSIATNHTISKHVHENMKRDVSIVVARFVVFLRDLQSYKEFLECHGTDAQQLLDLLQDLLDLDSFSVVKPLLFKALVRLSRFSGLHPRCLALSGLQKVGQQVTGGGFADIWKGLVRGQGVCVKIMRIFEDSNVEAVLKEFAREAVIWRQLCHPNVLPFFGIYYLDNRLCLVSPWMEYGNVLKFLAVKKPTNPERLSLILDVALGLQYLHERKIIHGDLKGLNILVTPSRRACIADFGVCSITNAMTVRFTHTTVTARASTARYQAPELFRGESENHLGSDVYAFACVCHEIMTEKVPFHELPNDMTVMFKVLGGHRPSRPLSCSATALDGLWELMQKCWEERAQMRPTATEIVERLVAPSIAAQPTPFNADWSDEFTSKFRRSQQAEPLLPSVTQIEHMLFGEEAAKACPECFPAPEPSDRQDEQVAQQPKRRYEDSNPDSEDVMSEQPAAEKSKPGST